MNKWKVASIILMVMVVLLLVQNVYQNRVVTFGGLTMKLTDANAFADLSQGKQMIICDLNDRECYKGNLVHLD